MIRNINFTKNLLLSKEYRKSELFLLILKSFRGNLFLSFIEKYYVYERFFLFSKKGSISLFRNKCLFTGWSRSVFRMFKMSRHTLKVYASVGLLGGLRETGF